MLFVYSRFIDVPELLLLFPTPFWVIYLFKNVFLRLIKSEL